MSRTAPLDQGPELRSHFGYRTAPLCRRRDGAGHGEWPIGDWNLSLKITTTKVNYMH
jgi:hypothetical protein